MTGKTLYKLSFWNPELTGYEVKKCSLKKEDATSIYNSLLALGFDVHMTPHIKFQKKKTGKTSYLSRDIFALLDL
jgi:hypothetical protein